MPDAPPPVMNGQVFQAQPLPGITSTANAYPAHSEAVAVNSYQAQPMTTNGLQTPGYGDVSSLNSFDICTEFNQVSEKLFFKSVRSYIIWSFPLT